MYSESYSSLLNYIAVAHKKTLQIQCKHQGILYVYIVYMIDEVISIVLFQMLRDRFKEFARDTENIGQERVAQVNEICDQLIQAGHSDAATIAEWKDGINEAWADLLELIDTRTQMLAASWQLHKFFHDCKETLDRINEKKLTIPEELGKDAQSVAALQRRHANFEHDLVTLGAQVSWEAFF